MDRTPVVQQLRHRDGGRSERCERSEDETTEERTDAEAVLTLVFHPPVDLLVLLPLIRIIIAQSVPLPNLRFLRALNKLPLRNRERMLCVHVCLETCARGRPYR